MATWYVRKTGNDASAGTSAGTAWLTVGHALSGAGNAATVAAGDTIWVGAGTYRELVTCSVSGSAGSPIAITADWTGANTGDAGEVIITAYTTNDSSAAGTASATIVTGAKIGLTFTGFTIIGSNKGTANCVDGTAGAGHDIIFKWCVFNGSCNTNNADAVAITNTTAVEALNYTFDSCVFLGARVCIQINLVNSGAGADYSSGVIIKNCLFIPTGGANSAADAVQQSLSGGATTFKGGGTDIRNCTILSPTNGVASGANTSTSVPMVVYNCYIAASVCLSANGAGMITEDYNALTGPTPRTNVSVGTHSSVTIAPSVEVGQAFMRGAAPRLFGTPMSGAALLGFGNQASSPSVDALGYSKPSGGLSPSSAIGWLERANTWAKETGTVHTGSNSISITGPGCQEFQVPVDTSSTSITLYMRYDATYAGTKPSMQIVNGGQAGVANATATMAGASGQWEQLTLSFTATSAGIITLRVVSSDTNGGGKAFADTFAVA